MLVSLYFISLIFLSLSLTIMSSSVPPSPSTFIKKKNISVIGAGSWGTAIASKLGRKLQHSKDTPNDLSETYNERISLWLYDEMLPGNIICNKWCPASSSSTNATSLVDIINDTHENVKYLPGIILTSNVIATPDIVKATATADVLIFVIPHEFLAQTLAQMKGHCKESCVLVSLTKGLHVTEDGPKLLSEVIAKELRLKSTAVLMGANCAGEVAKGDYCEATVSSSDLKISKGTTKINNSNNQS